MKKQILIGLSFIFSLMSSSAIVRASGEDKAFNISYVNDNLSANIKNSSLDYVLAEVTKKTGVEFVLNKKLLENDIYAEFASLPLEEAIQKILNKFNYAMIYASTGEIQKVIVTGKRTGSSTNFKLTSLSPDTANQQSNTTNIKKNKLPEGMTMAGRVNNMSGNNAPDGMVSTKLSKKTDENNVSDSMDITKQTKNAGSNNIPDGMAITEQPKNVSGNKAPDGMVIPPPPDKKSHKNLPLGSGSLIKKN